jgi:diaminohydroxyphosphoribosylaminopyrimidine deaminase/5-amino-6-(5-phosphoribosylamino)uracil reductase
LTGDEAREYVRELRIAHDAVAVGAGTVRVDNPQLTVRPPHHRLREYVRIVMCETDTVEASSNVFLPEQDYAQTIVVAPAGVREKFSNLCAVGKLIFVGDDNARQLDMSKALQALHERGITSMLCEGGPTMAGYLLQQRLVDRLVWLVAPRLLRTGEAVPVVGTGNLAALRGLRFDGVERLGADLLISGRFEPDV